MGDIKARLEDLSDQIQSSRQEQILSENVYQLLSAFDELYADLKTAENNGVLSECFGMQRTVQFRLEILK